MRNWVLWVGLFWVIGSASAQSWPRNPGDLPGSEGATLMAPPDLPDPIGCALQGHICTSPCVGTPITWVGWHDRGPELIQVPNTNVFILKASAFVLGAGVVVADGSQSSGEDPFGTFWFPAGAVSESDYCGFLNPPDKT